MRFSIVEDEKVWQKIIADKVRKYSLKKNIFINVKIYDDETYCISEDDDMIFLDIDMPKENGFSIAERIMKQGCKSKICFLTSHPELARKGYKVNAFRFIDKAELEEIDEAIDSYLKSKIQENSIIITTEQGTAKRITIKDIVFIETYGRKLRYNLRLQEKYIAREKFSLASNVLEPFGFFKIQRSYLVNLGHIISINSREVVLTGDCKLTVSRKTIGDLKKTYMKYRMEYGE
ncbi:MAG: response regulator transcription factor [Lachnospiraceae bacterium]|nr:response regulator transcription factor [Lachnospiraceae bacterium]